MRYIIFYDINVEDVDSVFECDTMRRETGESIPDLFPPHLMAEADGKFSGFVVLDVGSEDQIAKYIMQYAKAGKRNMRAVPIFEVSKAKEIWKNLKK